MFAAARMIEEAQRATCELCTQEHTRLRQGVVCLLSARRPRDVLARPCARGPFARGARQAWP
eukprot:6016982-Lingulodinium_polyedra.AAC.1